MACVDKEGTRRIKRPLVLLLLLLSLCIPLHYYYYYCSSKRLSLSLFFFFFVLSVFLSVLLDSVASTAIGGLFVCVFALSLFCLVVCLWSSPRVDRRTAFPLASQRGAVQQQRHTRMNIESTRAYLDHTCVPLLMEAMATVSRVRPDDPIDFIAHYLLQHNPNRRGTTSGVGNGASVK